MQHHGAGTTTPPPRTRKRTRTRACIQARARTHARKGSGPHTLPSQAASWPGQGMTRLLAWRCPRRVVGARAPATCGEACMADCRSGAAGRCVGRCALNTAFVQWGITLNACNKSYQCAVMQPTGFEPVPLVGLQLESSASAIVAACSHPPVVSSLENCPPPGTMRAQWVVTALCGHPSPPVQRIGTSWE